MAKTHHPKGPLVAGVYSSTQSVMVVIRSAHTGELIRQGRGAAREAAWALSGDAVAPQWNLGDVTSAHIVATPEVVERYRLLRDRTEGW